MKNQGGFGGQTLAARKGGIQLGVTHATTARRGLSHQRVRDDVSVTPQYVRGLNLSSRDYGILRYLSEVGYATAEQLAALFFYRLRKPVKKARERLKELWELHVLDRITAEPLVKYGFGLQLAYMVGRAGRLLLAELDPKRQLPSQRRGGLLLAHNALLGQAIVNLYTQFWPVAEREVVFYGEQAAYALFQWENRFVSLRPDGMLMIRNVKRNHEVTFFVELDTGQQEVASFRAKTKAYELYMECGDWRERYGKYPRILVILWAASRLEGAAGDADRRRLADTRLQRVIETVKEASGYKPMPWAFTRLDTIATDAWWLLHPGGQVEQRYLFD